MRSCAALLPDVEYCDDAYHVAEDCDAIIVITEWEEFSALDMKKLASVMKRPVIIDSRNLYDPAEMAECGFVYEGIGRGGIRQKIAELVPSLIRG